MYRASYFCQAGVKKIINHERDIKTKKEKEGKGRMGKKNGKTKEKGIKSIEDFFSFLIQGR